MRKIFFFTSQKHNPRSKVLIVLLKIENQIENLSCSVDDKLKRKFTK